MSRTLLFTILFVKAVLSLLWISHSGVGLVPDEAQYWTWSQSLDWGYYSKPPGIAWQMAIGTSLLGNTEVGIRFVAVVFAALQAWLVYRLALAAGVSEKGSLWAGVAWALTPMGVLGSLMATTDGGLVVFWTLGCLVLLSRQNPYLLGLVIGCGALFKWPIYILWFFAIPRMRSWHLLGGIGLSLVGLIPSVVWNISHDFATFKHVLTTITGSNRHEVGILTVPEGNFWSFLGAQALLISPLLFILLGLSGIYLFRHWKKAPPSIQTCGLITFALLLVYTFVSCFKKMQGNWCVFAYPTGIVVLVWYVELHLKKGFQWLFGGMVLSMSMILACLTLPLPYSLSPFRHQMGWDQLPTILTTSGYDPDTHFLFGDKYQMTSLLSFYAPQQKRAYFLNLHGTRKNQFSFWPSLAEEQLGKTGYYVLAENRSRLDEDYYLNLLRPYFRSVHCVNHYPLYFSKGMPVKEAIVIRCERYNGRVPKESNKY